MTKERSASDERLAALRAADRYDLAARLLATAFAELLDKPYPRRTGAELGLALARLGSVELRFTGRDSTRAVLRLVLELVLIWERAGVACRGMDVEYGEVVLLERGESLMRSDDRVDAIRRALRP